MTTYAHPAADFASKTKVSASLVFDETQPTWRDIVPRKTVVHLQIGLTQPLELTWEQFTDLANCCKELAERNLNEREHRFGSVYINIAVTK